MTQIIQTIQEMREVVNRLRQGGKRIGCVPTMGALHEGHLSLMREARKRTDVVVLSIFVNPIQFGPDEDYEQYPRDLSGDARKVEGLVDWIFAPSVEEIYPAGFSTFVEVHGLSEILEGTSRPGHFRGVATVVTKLLHIMQPHQAFFGQKDYQQALLLQKMVEDLNMDCEVVILPTVREKDGLALSSRNVYLTPEERRAATILYQALLTAKSLIEAGERSASVISNAMERMFREEERARTEYIAICHPKTLREIKEIQGETLIALSVWIGKTRLIDNLIIKTT